MKDDSSGSNKRVVTGRARLILAVTLAGISGAALAGECANKKPEWLFCEDFEGSTFLSQWQEVSFPERKARETNKANVFEGASSLKLTFPPGSTDGAGWMHYWWTPATDQNEVFMRWYVKYSNGFNYGGWDVKMAGLEAHLPGVKYRPGAGYVPDGTWYQSRLFSLGVNNGAGAGPKQPVFYYYHPDQKTNYGDVGAQNRNLPAVTFADDRWYCLEIRVKPNTVATNSNGTYTGLYDGEQTLWIDGVEKGHYSGIRWRTKPTVKINDLYHSAWVGQPRASANQYRWEDNYVVSTARIGCYGALTPSSPSSLTVR